MDSSSTWREADRFTKPPICAWHEAGGVDEAAGDLHMSRDADRVDEATGGLHMSRDADGVEEAAADLHLSRDAEEAAADVQFSRDADGVDEAASDLHMSREGARVEPRGSRRSNSATDRHVQESAIWLAIGNHPCPLAALWWAMPSYMVPIGILHRALRSRSGTSRHLLLGRIGSYRCFL